MYDVIILGAGPAALTAQIYALRYNLRVVAIGGVVGGLITETHKICNWPGEIAISGQDLTRKMRDQVVAMDGEIVTEQIAKINRVDAVWQVETVGKKVFVGKTVLYALGTAHRKLGLSAEEHLAGRGVTYCVTCDGPFYKNKTVAVVGGGNSAMTAALYLADLCPKVYLIYRAANLKGESVLAQDIAKHPAIISLPATNIIELKGQERLEAVRLDKAYNEQETLEIEGLFIEIGTQPKTELLAGLNVEFDDQGRIKVRADQTTSLSGLWAAGDVTDGSNGFRQIVTACGEGAVAADSIYKALTTGF